MMKWKQALLKGEICSCNAVEESGEKLLFLLVSFFQIRDLRSAAPVQSSAAAQTRPRPVTWVGVWSSSVGSRRRTSPAAFLSFIHFFSFCKKKCSHVGGDIPSRIFPSIFLTANLKNLQTNKIN